MWAVEALSKAGGLWLRYRFFRVAHSIQLPIDGRQATCEQNTDGVGGFGSERGGQYSACGGIHAEAAGVVRGAWHCRGLARARRMVATTPQRCARRCRGWPVLCTKDGMVGFRHDALDQPLDRCGIIRHDHARHTVLLPLSIGGKSESMAGAVDARSLVRYFETHKAVPDSLIVILVPILPYEPHNGEGMAIDQLGFHGCPLQGQGCISPDVRMLSR